MTKKNEARDRALARFLVVSKVNELVDRGMNIPVAVELVSKEYHVSNFDVPKKVSKRSIYRWLSNYKKYGFEGLIETQKTRSNVGQILDQEVIDQIKYLKSDDEQKSIPEILKIIKRTPDFKDTPISRSTVWRFCQNEGIPTSRPKGLQKNNMKRFAYRHRMQMVLCDGKHFKVGPQNTKRVAFVFIDDATRKVLHAVVGASETSELFLRGLYELILKYGFMINLYADNGSGFISKDDIEVCARLKINLIHGTVRYPEGKGKIERFNRTLKAQCLRHWQGSPEVKADFEHLNLRLHSYFENNYNISPHESLDGKTPKACFDADSRKLVFPSSKRVLDGSFITRVTRRVSKDNCIKLHGTNYEMPLGYAGTKQQIRIHVFHRDVSFLHQGKIIRLQPVDIHQNATIKRKGKTTKPRKRENEETSKISNANFSYNDAFGPIVDEDGSFYKEEEI